MNILTRLRIVIFALMVLGAFADFAQNEWGNYLIVVCEALISFTFLFDAVKSLIQRLKQENRKTLNLVQLGGALVLFVLLYLFMAWQAFFLFWYPLFAIIELVDAKMKKRIKSLA